ncbi:hypothetical protein [Piscinibacter sp.]|uniref:hypothetical protein n=1 Tax=Piscinibacter sp. TaxID=1903157 RepID=UPI002BE23905|nr:hypothetical protein [Albitalea sp.]HUG23534.1 hypothetical protein [Albitalea sp.]
MKTFAVSLALLAGASVAAPPEPRCAGAAVEQARKLLQFHLGSDDRIEIDKDAVALAPLPNPANRKQAFDVVEVWGYVYKGQYRMRFIYAQRPQHCVLMGQEILEYADL